MSDPGRGAGSSALVVAESSQLRRLRWKIAAIYAACWLLGLGTLLAVAIIEGQQRRLEQLDAELQLRATVVYGLAWFDENGTVRDDLLLRETWVQDSEFPIQIVRADAALSPLWGSPMPAALRDEIEPSLRDVAVGRQESWLGDAQQRRVHALPMFADDSPRIVGVAIVSADLSALRQQQWGYFGSLLIAFVGLALTGMAAVWWLSAMSVAPLQRLFRGRARFIAAAAHELRTPLSTLRAVAESGRAGDEAASVALARVESVTTAAARRVDTLLWHARLAAGETAVRRRPARVDLLIDRACEDFEHARVVGEAVTATIDDALISVAIANLLGNAQRHAAAEGGRGVVIGAEADHLWVQDNGPGFSADVLTRGDLRSEHPQGSGLGLSVVQMIARLHGGRVEVRKAAGGGARVELHWSVDEGRN